MTKSKNQPDIEHVRHSLAHLLAMAVLKHDPKARLAIGPAIEHGFYYDFELSRPISEAHLPKLEKIIRALITQNLDTSGKKITITEAKKLFKDQPFKLDLIKEFAKEKKDLTVYHTGNFVDLCKGGHVKSTKEINPDAFALTHVAGAYWRGDEKNPMLTRVYGVAFATKEELSEHLAMLEEAKLRDHRTLGKQLDLFIFSDLVGKGLPLWTEKGTALRRTLERFIVDEEIKRGYQHVTTPDIATLDLYRTSGHYPYYKDSMYAPMAIDDEEFMLRPMTCPHHFELFRARPRSWRELPMRIAEVAKLYRYEQSGELTGLIRVRSFCLADAHILCQDKKQAVEEIGKALDLIEHVAGTFDLKMKKDYWYRLSLGDRKEKKKYFQNDAAWDESEAALRALLKKRKCHFVEAENDAAFYGPKIDIQMRNVRGKEDTAFTVQYDFCMPSRFKLEYRATDGTQKPIAAVIHRSSIGALERIIAFLIERYAGAFPFWLAPVQVAVLPIGEKQTDHAQSIYNELMSASIRAELHNSADTLGKRIRGAEQQKIPYLLIIGEKEIAARTVAVRQHGKGDLGTMTLKKFLSSVK